MTHGSTSCNICCSTNVEPCCTDVLNGILGFHSRDQQPCFSTKTKEGVSIIIAFNSRRIGLGHQHGRHFIVWGHQHGGRDVMWNPRIELISIFVQRVKWHISTFNMTRHTVQHLLNNSCNICWSTNVEPCITVLKAFKVCLNNRSTFLLFFHFSRCAGMAHWWEHSPPINVARVRFPDSAWVEFVGFLLCTERFSQGTLVSPLLKNQHLTWFALIVNFSWHCPQLVLQR